jgi:hypothetical protein
MAARDEAEERTEERADTGAAEKTGLVGKRENEAEDDFCNGERDRAGDADFGEERATVRGVNETARGFVAGACKGGECERVKEGLDADGGEGISADFSKE